MEEKIPPRLIARTRASSLSLSHILRSARVEISYMRIPSLSGRNMHRSRQSTGRGEFLFGRGKKSSIF